MKGDRERLRLMLRDEIEAADGLELMHALSVTLDYNMACAALWALEAVSARAKEGVGPNGG